MSKDFCLHAVSGRPKGLIASCTAGSCSRVGCGQIRRRVASQAAVTGHEISHPDSADAKATLRPRPTLRVPTPERDAGAGGPSPHAASALDSEWTHVEINNELAKAQSLEELFRVVEAGHQRFNKVNAVTALHRIARVRILPMHGSAAQHHAWAIHVCKMSV